MKILNLPQAVAEKYHISSNVDTLAKFDISRDKKLVTCWFESDTYIEHRCLDLDDFLTITREGGVVQYGMQAYSILEVEDDKALLMINKEPTWVENHKLTLNK